MQAQACSTTCWMIDDLFPTKLVEDPKDIKTSTYTVP